MNLTFNTNNTDSSIVVKALQQYRSGAFEQAVKSLVDILDSEPNNWQARLMLAVCYYRTNQLFAAERAFRSVYEQADDKETRQKGLEGLQSTKAKMQMNMVGCPDEFRSHFERGLPQVPYFGWLESSEEPQQAPVRAWKPSFNR